MNKRKSKALIVAFSIMLASVFGAIVSSGVNFAVVAQAVSPYVEIYSPSDDIEITTTNSTYFTSTVEDNEKTESGKGLVLNYTVHTSDVAITLPISVENDADGFEGLAIWLDIPQTADEYSFTMRIANTPNALQYLRKDKTLTLIDAQNHVTEQVSVLKRLFLNGFTGWLMIPASAYYDCKPLVEYEYTVTFLMEVVADENAIHTEDFEMTIGSFGYYTDYYSFLIEKGGEQALNEKADAEFTKYLSELEALEPQDNAQTARKNAVVEEFTQLKANFTSLSNAEKISQMKGLYDRYVDGRENYLYGDVKATDYVTSFAIMSDTHFSSTWVNTEFLTALEDAKALSDDLSGVYVLGDLSDQGVSATDPSYSDLDNYYDWLDSFEYKNALGEDIPFTNILGNHDVRGSSGASDGRKDAAYQAAVALYKQREKVDSIQFDKWIDGYHYIFLNTDTYHKDDCNLTAETITWLDETLAENEDGRPIFVMVHQPLARIHALEGASMTFAEVIARHPSAIVSSGHTHAVFGNASIVQNGEGNYINQPSMKTPQIQYYLVEVYEGGVVYKAREVATNSWIFDSYVVVKNEDYTSRDLFRADIFEDNLSTTNVTTSIVSADSVTGNAIKLAGSTAVEDVVIPAGAMGNINNYAGYAVYITCDTPVKLAFGNVGVKANAKYYSVNNRVLSQKTANDKGEVLANGWVIIPKDALDGVCAPSKNTTLVVSVGATQTVYLDKVCYFFDTDAFIATVSDKTENQNNKPANKGCAGVIGYETTMGALLLTATALCWFAIRKNKKG